MPLSTFASLRTTAEPRELKKFQQLNAVRIQGVIPPPVPLDQALSFLETRGAARSCPQGFTIDYAGRVAAAPDRGQQLPRHVPAVGDPDLPGARGAVRELPRSVHHPGRIGAARGLRRAAVLVPRLTTLNIYSQVGLITLVGLVAKNGILIVQFANHLQETGKDKLAAIIEAAGTRLRPILMTTAATVVGHFPLVIATGPGAGARNSIGIMLVSGMIIGTLFTLFVVPSIYMLLARKRVAAVGGRRRRARRRSRAGVSAEGAAA